MQEKKAKNSGWFRRTFFTAMGQKRSRALLSFLLKKKHKVPQLSFPVDIPAVKEILIVLPEEHLQVLHQLRNIISLMTLFKHAGITLLCERGVAPYIKMVPGLNIVEYNAQDHFSAEFSRMAQQFRGSVDICFLLDTTPELPVLYLVGATAAGIRVGYCDVGEYPFLNLHIRPSEERTYLADWYSCMAETFGARSGEIRWRVAQKTVEEVEHLIKELKMKPDAPLLGFDAVHFMRSFGIEWTEKFLAELNKLKLGTIYFHVAHETREEELIWLCKQNVPSFPDLSTSRLAALVSKSKIVISGNTPMYALAGLLFTPAVGFFPENEIERYCPQSALLKGVACKGQPDEENIAAMLDLVVLQATVKKKPAGTKDRAKTDSRK
jgi:ADP-heptose:LPS heptosyltransferase